jgi:hypothetical protein
LFRSASMVCHALEHFQVKTVIRKIFGLNRIRMGHKRHRNGVALDNDAAASVHQQRVLASCKSKYGLYRRYHVYSGRLM